MLSAIKMFYPKIHVKLDVFIICILFNIFFLKNQKKTQQTIHLFHTFYYICKPINITLLILHFHHYLEKLLLLLGVSFVMIIPHKQSHLLEIKTYKNGINKFELK